MNVLALIPARAGSKGIPHKNIMMFCGKPLLVHSIEQARLCPRIQRVIVSTDSEDYARIAREAGAETPFLRPENISGDLSTDLEVFTHCLNWLKQEEQYLPDLCVHLRPTHPNRRGEAITEAIDLIAAHPHWDAVRSVSPAPETPFKMWFRQDDGTLDPVISTVIPEAHSQPRQALPPVYLQNASIDVIRSRTIQEQRSMVGRVLGAYVMAECHDIDTAGQMATAAAAFHRGTDARGKVFCVDIDGVIATITPGNDYRLAKPIDRNISRINQLYDGQNRIVLFTARGSMTGLDWRELTEQQMREWGVKYHELRFGKPAADFYVDDRMISLADFSPPGFPG